MASYQHLVQCSDTRFQSPAKVFAILKSRVQSGEQTTCGVGEEYAAQMKPALSRTQNTWEPNELHHRFGEVEASTISPIKSPKKSLDDAYSDYNRQAMELPHTSNTVHRFRSPVTHFMESTAAFPLRVDTDPSSTRDPREIVDKSVTRFETELFPIDACMPPVSIFPPARKKSRKRKLEEQEMNAVGIEANVTSEIEDDNMEIAGGYRYTPNKSTCSMTRCTVSLEKLMSPAKMFAYMKERVFRRELEQDSEDCQEPSEPPNQVVHTGYRCQKLQIESPVTQELADSQSDTFNPEEDSPFAVESDHILFDPILLNRPSISISKKQNSMFKDKQRPNFTKIPNESAFSLEKWFLRRNRNGLFVQGIRMEDRIPWNSNIILERISSTVLKTLSGNVYKLVGKMNLDVDTDFPRWLLRKFAHGFPSNWKELYEKWLSELKDRRKVNTEKRSKVTKSTTETSALNPTMKRPKKNAVRTNTRQKQPQADTYTSSKQVTRSGRLIKPPLDYWKGGRVILDADMNVTIFECYNTIVLSPNVAPEVYMEKSRKPAQAFLLSDKGHKPRESIKESVQPPPLTKDKTIKESVQPPPLTKDKTSLRRHSQVQIQPDENPPVSTEAAVKRRSHRTANSHEKSSNEDARPSSKPQKLPPRGSKGKVCNAPPVNSRKKHTPSQVSAINNKLSEPDEQQDERRANHIARTDEQVSNEATMPKPPKFPLQESKKKVLNARPLKRSRIKHTSSQFSALDKQLSESNSLEEQEVLSTKRKKRDKRKHTHTLPSPSKPKNLPGQRSKKSVLNTPPLVRSTRKHPPPDFFAVYDISSESEEEEEPHKRRSHHTTCSDDQSDIENTLSSRSKSKKLPRQGSKTKTSNAPPLTKSGRNCAPPQLPAAHEKLPESSSLEKKAALSTKRKKQGKRTPRKQDRNPQSKSLKQVSLAKALTQLPQSKKLSSRGSDACPQGQDEDEWTQDELTKLQQAVSSYPSHTPFYWAKVAMMVGTRSAEECHNKDLALQDCHTPTESTRKKQKKKAAKAAKGTGHPIISAGMRTFKRKQQVRQFLETMPRENTDDAFSATHNQCFEIPSMCLDGEQDFKISQLEPLTPVSLHFPQVKTPRCLHASPGLVYSTNRSDEDRYVFQLQKAIKQNQVNGHKNVPAKDFVPTPAVKRRARPFEKTGNDSFVMREMFPEKAAMLSDSGEEEDFYFSDND
ncbi:mis18-binding protein 1 isoform X2 [Hippocampus comes]|uniref:mis18-binding protein 1 isoform X2 n=1 Tax=Hippocampus comes TaxID=109280 RepID=UPI00094F3305|nr:PREDICTED: mis18-binding protein 1 isoform X2 [Hippocampus comes]